MEKIWRYGRRERYFDISEAGCMLRLTEALEGWKMNQAALAQNDTPAAQVQAHCAMIQDFFDDLFGDGSGAEICGAVKSAEVCTRMFLHFLRFLSRQAEDMQKLRAQAEEGYLARLAALGLDRREAKA